MADKAVERYGILKDEESGDILMPDPNKFVRILKAYGNSDP